VEGSAPRSVSVAIPVFNGGAFLGEAIGSARAQTLAPTELLVFDNASTDGSADLARDLLGPDAVHAVDVNRGASWNFNRAASESTGEYFAWLAADDRLHPRFLEVTLPALAAAPDAAACLTSFTFISPDGRVSGEQRTPRFGHPDVRPRLRDFLRRYRWTEVYCLYRRARLVESPMFRDESGADVTLIWWFLLRGPFVIVDEPLWEYRTSPEKSVQELADSLTKSAKTRRWHKMYLWRALWRETSHPDLPSSTRRIARQELVTALFGRHWIVHNAADAFALIPSRRAAKLFVRIRTWHRKRQGRA
jgi:glycosyltransferase involved in cell wall biosynthesis